MVESVVEYISSPTFTVYTKELSFEARKLHIGCKGGHFLGGLVG